MMGEAARGNNLKVQEKFKDKWFNSETVARQATGVFLGGNKRDFDDTNPLVPSKKLKRFSSK